MVRFSIELDTRTQKQNGKYPLKLRVIQHTKVRFISLGAEYSQKEFDLIFNRTPVGILLDHRNKAHDILNKALKINEQLTPFDFEMFKTLLLKKETDSKKNPLSLEDLFKETIENKRKNDELKTALVYRSTINSLLKFRKSLVISDITPEFLHDYEKWMILNNGAKETATIGFYLRNLRAIINGAKNRNLLPKDFQYPFLKHLYVIPTVKRIKRTLQREEIESIIDLTEFDSSAQRYSRDLWLVQFYCNGINLKDLIKLRWDNRVGNCFVIKREKTKKTSRSNPRHIKIPITVKLGVLLNQIGTSKSPYVLGYINESMTETQILDVKSKLSKRLNIHLKEISKKLKLSIELKTKTARDAYATSLKKQNISIEKISEMLGHSSTMTTQHYLDDFDDQELHQINSNLP